VFYILQNVKYESARTRRKTQDARQKTEDRRQETDKKRIDQPTGKQGLSAIPGTTFRK